MAFSRCSLEHKNEFGRSEAVHLKLIYGDPSTAALYNITDGLSSSSVENEISAEELQQLLKMGALDLPPLSKYLAALQNGPYRAYIKVFEGACIRHEDK